MENYIDVNNDGGIKKQIITEGNGAQPKKGQKVSVNYVGTFEDGKQFDASEEPFKFKLGAGEVIKGWDEGVATMKIGEKSKFVLRHDYAYGEQGYPGVIPKKATLVFVVELLKIQ
jgi:FKBP-type peptidyl-prolyl cis-trans isomerase